MATTITNMSAVPLRYPTHGRFHIQSVTRVMVPGFAPSTLGDLRHEFHFNPLIVLSSPPTAFSFFSSILAAVNYEVGAEIVDRIAAFAFHQVRSRNWFHGLSLSVVLETIHVLEAAAATNGGHLVSNDRAGRDYYEALDGVLFDMMIQPFASTGAEDHGSQSEDDDDDGDDTVGISEREISMLMTERVTDDEDEECCCICLEGFTRGAVITPLPSCSHRFHHGCIVPWLRNNRTCPICRGMVNIS